MIPPCERTLDIDEDVLQAAKELAAQRGGTAGDIVSELAHKALEPRQAGRVRNGVPVLPRRSGTPLLTVERVNRLLDEP
jgi:hypothetical protein